MKRVNNDDIIFLKYKYKYNAYFIKITMYTFINKNDTNRLRNTQLRHQQHLNRRLRIILHVQV